jgi:glycosyltransferase involved in cell wall biosynthesis
MNASKDERETVDVSLFIISYNRAEYLAEAVKSALEQTHRPRDITILDNGSRPDVKAAVEPLLERGVTWIGSDRTNSPSWNIRRAFTLAQGKYFVTMHDDDRLVPNFLKEQADFLDRNPEVVAVGCNAFRIDAKGDRGGSLFPRREERISWFRTSADVALLYSQSGAAIPFPTIMYRNGSAQKKEFRYDEFGKVLDVIYLCDLAQVGPIAYQDEMLYEYRLHANQDSVEIPEQTRRTLDRSLLSYASSNPLILRKMRKNLATKQMLRAYTALGKKFRNEPGLSTLFGQIEQIRPDIFTLGGFFSGILKYNREFLRYLKRKLKSRSNGMP